MPDFMPDFLNEFLTLISPYMRLLLLMVLPFALHTYLSLRRNKWTGLIFPVLFFIAVVIASLRNIGRGGDLLWVTGSFCLLNAPVVAGLIVYAICRNRVEWKRAEELAKESGEEKEAGGDAL